MTSFLTPRLIPEKADFRPALASSFMPGSIGRTMAKMTYAEQLKHPNWQRKRLERLEKSKFRCDACMDTDSTLHVHHKHYVKDRLAWEYDIEELATLCETCHEREHEARPERSELLARLDVDGPFGIDDFIAFGAGAMAIWLADDRWRELFKKVFDEKPLQVRLGRFAMWVGDNLVTTRDESARLVAILEGRDSQFYIDLAELLVRHGVIKKEAKE